MAAPLSVAAPLSAGAEMAWAAFEMKGPPHGQVHPPEPCPGRIPSLRLFRAQIQIESVQCPVIYRAESALYRTKRHFTKSTRYWPKHSAVDALPFGFRSHLNQEFKDRCHTVYHIRRRLKKSDNRIFKNNDLSTFQNLLLTEGEPVLQNPCHALGTMDNRVLLASLLEDIFYF